MSRKSIYLIKIRHILHRRIEKYVLGVSEVNSIMFRKFTVTNLLSVQFECKKLFCMH